MDSNCEKKLRRTTACNNLQALVTDSYNKNANSDLKLKLEAQTDFDNGISKPDNNKNCLNVSKFSSRPAISAFPSLLLLHSDTENDEKDSLSGNSSSVGSFNKYTDFEHTIADFYSKSDSELLVSGPMELLAINKVRLSVPKMLQSPLNTEKESLRKM